MATNVYSRMLCNWNRVDTRLSHCLELYECGDHCCTRLENLVERYQWAPLVDWKTAHTNNKHNKNQKKEEEKTRWHKVKKKEKQKTHQTESETHQCIPRDFFYTCKRICTQTLATFLVGQLIRNFFSIARHILLLLLWSFGCYENVCSNQIKSSDCDLAQPKRWLNNPFRTCVFILNLRWLVIWHILNCA